MTIQVVRATEKDIQTAVRMGRKFWSLTPFREIPYCPDSAAQLGRDCLAQGLLLLARDGEECVGMVGALASPLLMNRAVLVAAELFWWVEPRARNSGAGQLLLAGLEDAARAIGVKRLSMGAFTRLEVEKAGAVYEKAGYVETERTWNKDL